MTNTNRNIYDQQKTACESSANRNKIDVWLNDGKSNKYISERLRELDDYISPTSISKYRKYREELIMRELENTPEFKAKQQMVTDEFNLSVAKIQKVDLIGNLSELIEDSAELLRQAKEDDIKINNVKDMRMVQQTMLDAISVYGETMLNAQKFEEINNDPTLLQQKQTNINVSIRGVLTDILSSSMKEGNSSFDLVDQIRRGMGRTHSETVNEISVVEEGDIIEEG